MSYMQLCPQGIDPVLICIGSLKSVNSVGNIIQAGSLQKNSSNLRANEKGLHHLGHVVVWFIHLYLYIYKFNHHCYIPISLVTIQNGLSIWNGQYKAFNGVLYQCYNSFLLLFFCSKMLYITLCPSVRPSDRHMKFLVKT